MIIQKLSLGKSGREVVDGKPDHKETRVSFYFDDGDNWHFQLKRNASKRELKNALLGVAKLIPNNYN